MCKYYYVIYRTVIKLLSYVFRQSQSSPVVKRSTRSLSNEEEMNKAAEALMSVHKGQSITTPPPSTSKTPPPVSPSKTPVVEPTSSNTRGR